MTLPSFLFFWRRREKADGDDDAGTSCSTPTTSGRPSRADPPPGGREGVWVKDADLLAKVQEQEQLRTSWLSTLFLAWASLGIIYGDIGTSIIYVYSQIFFATDLASDDPHGVKEGVLGAISLIFWTLTLIALLKYVGVVLRANDTGEGGTVALYAQLCRTMGISPFGTMRMQDHKQVLAMRSASSFTSRQRPTLGEHRHRAVGRVASNGHAVLPTKAASKTKDLPLIRPWKPPMGFAVLEGQYIIRWFRRTRLSQRVLLLVTMVATGLVIGDGVLMPAFSVNSAISGIEQHTGGSFSSSGIVGISVTIIFLLFVSQHVGTQKIAFMFSPVIVFWLTANLGIAIYNLNTYGGEVFQGLNPQYIVRFFAKYKVQGWEMLGGVMLCVSGTETMFAAMGHFSQPAVALAFGGLAYPCLVLSYLGQGAYLLQHPEDAHVTFWASIPDPIFWPMLVLATLAAIVASQAVITGTFSIIRQATALGVFPKLHVIHTDSFVEGQIFIPSINYILMLLCIAVIAGFGGDNSKLGDAYGVAVMAVMLVTTGMVTLIMLVKWDISLLAVLPFFLLFLLIEGVFLSANLFKVPSGGWFPLAVAFFVCLIMSVWWGGSYARRRLLLRSSKEQDASSYFFFFTGEDQSRHPVALPESASLNDLRSMYGSAVDLGAPITNSAGYHASSPLRPHSSTLQRQQQQQQQQQQREHLEMPPPVRTSGAVSGDGGASSASAGAGTAALDGAVEGIAPLRLSDVNLASSLSTPRGHPSVRFAGAQPHDPVGDGESTAGSSSSPRAMHKVSISSMKGSVVASQPAAKPPPAPRPVLALVSHPKKPLAKLSGLGVYYSDSPIGIPAVLKHFLHNVDAMHEAGIFLTVRFLPMPSIKNVERFLVRAISGLPNFYQVVARYGYQDVVDHSATFVQQIITTIMHKLELKSGLQYQGLEDDFIHELEGDYVEDEITVQPDQSSRVFGLETVHEVYLEEEERDTSRPAPEPPSPFLSKFALEAAARIKIVATSPDASQPARDAMDAASALIDTVSERVVYYLGRSFTRSSGRANIFHSITIGGLYRTLELLAYTDSEAWHIPLDNMVALGMALEI